MKLDSCLEQKIKQEAIKFLEKGRSNWDIPHTLATVRWMKLLVADMEVDEKILVTTMYFHDTGYPILKKGYSYDDAIAAKKTHADLGAKNAKKVLEKLGDFSKEEVARVVYLIENHDKHDNITELDRQLVFEADGLGQIDCENVDPSFDKDNYLKLLEKYFNIERPAERWKTAIGKKYYQELLIKAYQYCA